MTAALFVFHQLLPIRCLWLVVVVVVVVRFHRSSLCCPTYVRYRSVYLPFEVDSEPHAILPGEHQRIFVRHPRDATLL